MTSQQPEKVEVDASVLQQAKDVLGEIDNIVAMDLHTCNAQVVYRLGKLKDLLLQL